ncbi:BrnT family toxin [Lichenibacterium dinghuense]|uniref:BrnT family toxin n=1 Tax=Lichenibacterium dinghuense TaxID=2895977 RepID=UPI001F32E80E|nr:BrnT family toxin [Lichenibacterium sp. 6Y81]
MRIIYDESKRPSNLDKHGSDMADFAEAFDFDGAARFPANPSRTGRARFGLIGWFNGAVVVAAIVSPLGSEALSLVSLRAASQQERDLYGF